MPRSVRGVPQRAGGVVKSEQPSAASRDEIAASRDPNLRAGQSYVRWWILALVFLGTTLNYLDRMVMGIVAPGLQKEYLISDMQYGYIQSAFALSYAFGQVF